MFASRRHSRRPKSCQLRRATSTLKHSSNQKGLRARNASRNIAARTVNKASESADARVHSGCAEEAASDPPALSFTVLTAVFGGGMLDRRASVWNANDIMLRIAHN